MSNALSRISTNSSARYCNYAAALAGENQAEPTLRSVREAEWFGMWADREDMQNLSSREWLAQLRAQQWGR